MKLSRIANRHTNIDMPPNNQIHAYIMDWLGQQPKGRWFESSPRYQSFLSTSLVDRADLEL